MNHPHYPEKSSCDFALFIGHFRQFHLPANKPAVSSAEFDRGVCCGHLFFLKRSFCHLVAQAKPAQLAEDPFETFFESLTWCNSRAAIGRRLLFFFWSDHKTKTFYLRHLLLIKNQRLRFCGLLKTND